MAAKQARLKMLREALMQKEGWRGANLNERVRRLREITPTPVQR